MRLLIAVGCDHYQDSSLLDLCGAVNDAIAVYQLLVGTELGQYDPQKSQLLCSPSHPELMNAISDALFDSGQIDVLTFFYAGHGAVKDGSYFVCLGDTQPDRLSVSALAFAQLLSWLNEAPVRHTNIIIDSCQSGGLARDIGSFLKPETVGRLGSPSVSIFASAAADQAAREVDGRGVGTARLLSCLTGEAIVQTNRPYVGLVEVGLVAGELMPQDGRQTCVCWGLNLYGESQLAVNAAYREADDLGRVHLPLTADRDVRVVVETYASRVWSLYLKTEEEFQVLPYIELLGEILSELPDAPINGPSFVSGLSKTFGQALLGSCDPFESVELYGASISILLPYAATSDQARSAIRDLAMDLLGSISNAIDVVLDALESDDKALLSEHSAFADLYFLPLRLLRILGWVGASVYVEEQVAESSFIDRPAAKRLIQTILDAYSGSITAVSDEQAPPLLALIWSSTRLDIDEELEVILGLLFESFHRYGGEVARPNLSGYEALRFTRARERLSYGDSEETVSRPCELLPCIFAGYRQLGIAEVLDESLIDLDHTACNIFIPDDYSDFAERRVMDGLNRSFRIGHDMWTMSDFSEIWGNLVEEHGASWSWQDSAIGVGAVCSSMVMPDRLAWFLVR